MWPAVASCWLASGVAGAEEVTAHGADTALAPAPKAAAGDRPAGSGYEAADAVKDADKPEHTREAVARMRDILSRVLKHLEEAREEKDVVKLNCVNEKLTAVKGLLKISEQADVSMQEAVARRDVEVSSHEFEKITIAHRKSEQLLAESEACVGELAVYAGDTQVELVVENVPGNDPTKNTGDVVVVQARPPAASPYQ